MRDYEQETAARVTFIRDTLAEAGASGIVYGNSGGKDSALVGILCKKACGDTVGLIMPCESRRNYEEDARDARAVAAAFNIEARLCPLTDAKRTVTQAVADVTQIGDMAGANIAPRLRMIALYAVAASENRLVAGTGNRSEAHVGYFTKWGDGACDFNPIADLTVREIYEFLRYLNCPAVILEKPPSAALFDGQTDEGELGVTYAAIDAYLLEGAASGADKSTIDRLHSQSAHKRVPPKTYGGAR